MSGIEDPPEHADDEAAVRRPPADDLGTPAPEVPSPDATPPEVPSPEAPAASTWVVPSTPDPSPAEEWAPHASTAPAVPAAPSAPASPSAPTTVPPAPAGWTALPPVRTSDEAEDHGWPAPPPLPPAAGREPAPPAPTLAPLLPPPAAPSTPPEPSSSHRAPLQSRNPVDRLTRGLPHPVRVTIDWIVTIVGAVAIVLLVKAFVVNPYRIPSSSMETTLHCASPASGCEARFSDRVLANRFLYRLRDPRRGEIIVFKTPPAAQIKCGAGGTFVKRLVGLPGEVVEVKVNRSDGYVYINGKRLEEPYLDTSRRGPVQEFGPVKVKPGTYFMMGDNRSQSCDSRMWGTVPRENLIGKVFATYWPPNRISLH